VKNLDVLLDKYESIKMFIEPATDLRTALRSAETVFRAEGKINLLTGHKSKGFEWPRVFVLDEALLKDKGQDPNLRYVIATRAQRELIYINSQDRVVEEAL
jgi:superfamily I DNA/RNA helicase